MKKVSIFFLSLLLLAGAGGNARAAGADIVVLMDASGTILPWFDQINGRILTDITKKFVRTGDTFHLISFNSRSNLEIVQPVLGEADVSRIVSRFMLLYPIGQNSDFLSGLQYTWQYVNTLDQLKQKIVIVISDGIFNPPPNSQFAHYTNEEVTRELESYARKIRGAGWNIYYIKLPFPENAEITALDGSTVSVPGSKAASPDSDTSAGDSSPDVTRESNSKSSNSDGSGTSTSGGTKSPEGAQDSKTSTSDSEIKEYIDVSGSFTDAVGINATNLPPGDVPLDFVDSVFGLPEVTFPTSLGKTGRTFILPLGIRNSGTEDLNLELSGVTLGNVDVLQRHGFIKLGKGDKGTLRAEIKLPDSIEKGNQSLRFTLQFAGNARVHPQEGTVSMVITGLSTLLFFRQSGNFVFAIVLIALAAAFVALLLILVLRHTTAPAHKAIKAAKNEEPKEVDSRQASSSVQAEHASIASYAESATKRDKNIAENIERKDKTIASEMAAAAWSGTDILTTEKKDKTIAFNVAKDKTIAFTASKPVGLDAEVNDFAAMQERQRKERYALLSETAKKPAHHTHIPAGADPDASVPVVENRSMMYELQVRYQTRVIGKRNIHVMKAGAKLSLGGGNSSFLVFLVKFPHRIADVRFDGKKCSLAILKPAYFPYETENVIEDCVGKEFTIVSDRDYEVRFTLKEYEDPVVKLNRLLTSIKF